MSFKDVMAQRGKLALVLSAGLGGFLAGFVDRVTKGGASTTRSVAERLWTDLGIGDQPEPKFAMLFFVAVAGLLTLIFDPKTKVAAFTAGIGIITSLFTAVPFQEKPAIPEASIAPISFEPGRESLLDRALGVAPAWAQPPTGLGSAHLVLERAPSLKECTLTILSLDRRQVVGRSRYIGRSEFNLSLPAGTYRLTIEAPGARSVSGEFRVVPGRASQLRAQLGPSSAFRVL